MFSGNTKNNKINMNTFLEFLTLIWLLVLPALSLLFLFLYCCHKVKNDFALYKLFAFYTILNFFFLFLGTKVVDNYVKMKNDIKSCTEREGAYYQKYIELLESNSKKNKNKMNIL